MSRSYDSIGRASIEGGTIEELDFTRATSGAYAGEETVAASAVSWGAIFAGAAAAAALSLILLILGTGLGLSSVSPWAHSGVTASTLGASTIVWLSVTQLLASGMGGYLAGGLRTKWLAVHTDEVYFRDTAHGFLAWCVASLATAALLSSVVGAIVSGSVAAGASVVGGAAAATAAAATTATTSRNAGGADTTTPADPLGYFVDSLFRDEAGAAGTRATTATTTSPGSAAEVGRIFVNSLRVGVLPADDIRYVGMLVAQRTGMSQQTSEQRVRDTYARMQTTLRTAELEARAAADHARKVAAYTALWIFVSLLIGAFVASFAATLGGRQRVL